MKIRLDERLCAVHGECVIEAPEIFDLGDDDDTAIILQDSPSESYRVAVERAAAACPVGAITIID
ncbi:ferredoxin [Mycobacterium sherrisii]|uniref:ferredoxin n=1 Tax=Mycobacterium sherrisii TaxID=243061 RepID=UPI000A165FAE|nr:ferredoxin [Mycobacterium sherrisii]MCV7032533.1 ferredoxin [Mycobacterium sherrisii]ORW74204.1 ferredoxin [Mycobacterium sherrisii]